MVVMLVGIGFLSVLTATIASYFVEHDSTFRFVTVDGAPADPPSLTTVAPKWEPGDTIPLGKRTLRVVGVRNIDTEEPTELIVDMSV